MDVVDQRSSNHFMAAIYQQEMENFNKLLEMQTEENEKIKELRQAKMSAKPPDLNA